MLGELFIPEDPTFSPNTAGWPPEDDIAWDLVPLDAAGTNAGTEGSASGSAAAAPAAVAALATCRAAAAAQLLPTFGSGGRGAAGSQGGGDGRPARLHTAADYHRWGNAAVAWHTRLCTEEQQALCPAAVIVPCGPPHRHALPPPAAPMQRAASHPQTWLRT